MIARWHFPRRGAFLATAALALSACDEPEGPRSLSEPAAPPAGRPAAQPAAQPGPDGAVAFPTRLAEELPMGHLARSPRATIVRLPAWADGTAEVVHAETGVGARFRLAGASPVEGQPTAEGAIYPAALQGADLVHRVGDHGTEDFVRFDARPEREELRYTLWPVGARALRQVDGVLEVLDARGAPRVRVPRPYLIDGHGHRQMLDLVVSGCAVDRDPRAPWSRPVLELDAPACEVVVRWGDLQPTYPVLVDPEWRDAGNMVVARTHHTATLLQTEGILLAGGFDPAGAPLNQAEIACPEEICAFPSFSATGPMAVARGAHTATALDEDTVLVAGGRNARAGTALASAEVYDRNTGTFVSAASMTRARNGHTATFIASTGKVLIAGGDELTPSTAEQFDPALRTFGPLLTMSARRTAHAAEALDAPGRVLLVGGIGSGGFTLQSAEVFDAQSGAFTALAASMTAPRAFATATLLEDGRVLVTGGTNGAGVFYSTADIFLPNGGGGGDFQQQPVVMQAPRAFHTATKLLGTPGVPGKVLLTGGFDGTDVLPDSEVFDADAVAFELTSTMLRPRSYHAATRLPSGQVIVTGGGFDGVSVDQPTAQSSEILLRQLGEPCAEGTECSSGFCPGAPQGVCCNAPCEGTCQTCAGGNCADVDDGTAVKPVCTDDVELLLVCAAGEVSAGQVIQCGAFACDGDNCGATCEGDEACSAVGWCNAGGCDFKKGVGESCEEDRECSLGFCADGVCCNARCGGQCQACDLAGAVGVCQQNAGAPREGRPSCDGAGGPCEGVCATDPDACSYEPVACSEGSCSEGSLTIGRCHLEARGQCSTTTEVCEPFACAADGTACAAECGSVEDCAPGRACRPDGQCVLVESAECDGDQVVSPDGTTTDCAPYACRSAACLEGCTSVDDCTAPSVCSEDRKCIDPPEDPAPPDGCAAAGTSGGTTWWVVALLGLVGATARRRAATSGAR